MILKKIGQRSVHSYSFSRHRISYTNNRLDVSFLSTCACNVQQRILNYDGPGSFFIINMSGKSVKANQLAFFRNLSSSSQSSMSHLDRLNEESFINTQNENMSLIKNFNYDDNKILSKHPKRSKYQKSTHNKPKRGDNNKHTRMGEITSWVKITGIPPLSTLDELLVDVERIMKTELSAGIVDLDAIEESLFNQIQVSKQDSDLNQHHKDQTIETNNYSDDNMISPSPHLPLWHPSDDDQLASHLVIEAHLVLSTLYRQAGWVLRFPNRSCVHALLSHIEEASKIRNQYRQNVKSIKNQKTNDYNIDHNDNGIDITEFSWMDHDVRPLMCGWKEVAVTPFYMAGGVFKTNIDWIDDTVVRVENCPAESTVDDLRYFFSQYGLMDDRILTTNDNKDNNQREAVQLVVFGGKGKQKEKVTTYGKEKPELSTPSSTNTFLVQFATSADARAAVREKQSTELLRRKIRLAQFSRQIIMK